MYKKHFTSTALPRLRDAPRPILHRALPIRHLHLGYRRRERIASAFIPAVLRASRLRRGWRRQPLILETHLRRAASTSRRAPSTRDEVGCFFTGVGGGGAGLVSCVGGVAGIHKSITRTAWSCANDGDAIGISREGRFGWGRVAFSRRQRALLVIVGGPSRCTLTGGICRKMAGEWARKGRKRARGVWYGAKFAYPRGGARYLASRSSSRASTTSPRVGRWRLGSSETKKEIRLPTRGARAMLRVSPRGSETDEPSAALDGALLVVSFAAERSGATRVLGGAQRRVRSLGGRAPKPDRCRKKEKGGNETRCCAPLGEIVSCTRRSDS